jgi:hypothetical protein
LINKKSSDFLKKRTNVPLKKGSIPNRKRPSYFGRNNTSQLNRRFPQRQPSRLPTRPKAPPKPVVNKEDDVDDLLIEDETEEEEEIPQENKVLDEDGKLDVNKVDPELLSKMPEKLKTIILKTPALYEKYSTNPNLIDEFNKKEEEEQAPKQSDRPEVKIGSGKNLRLK